MVNQGILSVSFIIINTLPKLQFPPSASRRSPLFELTFSCYVPFRKFWIKQNQGKKTDKKNHNMQILLRKIVPNSHLSNLLTSCSPLNPLDRALALEADTELESVYKSVALQGDSAVPTSAEAEVDFHYVCFVKSHKDGHLYEMDGDRKGPVDLGGLADDEDVLAEAGLSVVKKFIEREKGKGGRGNINFSLLVLVPG